MLLPLLCSVSIAIGVRTDEPVILAALEKACVPLGGSASKGSWKEFAPLEKLLGSVTIVGAGECTHGSREIFETKARLFQFLVERMGYTTLALEASVPGCVALDRYVTSGEGDPAEALKAQGFWTWSTEEVLDLVKWMRAYNADAKHKSKLRIVGVDMQDREGALDSIVQTLKDAKIGGQIVEDLLWFPRVRHEKGREAALNELDQIVKDALPKVEELLGKERATFFKQCARVFVQADELQQQSVVIDDFYEVRDMAMEPFATLKNRIDAIQEDAKSLPEEARYAIDIVKSSTRSVIEPTYDVDKLIKGVAQIREQGQLRKMFEEDYKNVAIVLDFMIYLPKYLAAIKQNPRDVFMAENTIWAVEKYLPKKKAMLWGHNYHIARTEAPLPESCGTELNRRIGKRYYPIGFAFGAGSFVARGQYDPDTGWRPLVSFTVDLESGGTLDRTLSKVKHSAFFINCATPALHTWLLSAHTTRNIGSNYDSTRSGAYVGPLKAGEFYRGLIFLREVTAAKTLKGMR
ncbi:MAG: erythromycin esterase family protein [Fimbriimonadaceae bacterium]|nr:erythromycin esterase family protein [Fimbriimonadaceae bacterium]